MPFDYEANYPRKIRVNFLIPKNKGAYIDSDVPINNTHCKSETRKYLMFSSESNLSVYKIVYH
jgi:hypothetical protein